MKDNEDVRGMNRKMEFRLEQTGYRQQGMEQQRFEHQSFSRRLNSMLSVDFRRMFTMPLFYIMMGTAFIIPILVLVMTTMMAGSVTIDPNTGAETTIEAFESVWQMLGTVSGSGMSMDLTSMCNINLIYFLIAVFVGLFVTDDFRSGYVKNLFTVRAEKTDYVISKTLTGFAGGAFMFLFFFAGTMLGGAVSRLSFELGEVGIGAAAMCMISKILLTAVFVPVYLAVSVAAKQKAWLAIVGSFCAGMLLYIIVPIVSPLDSGLMNVVMCLAGGGMFSAGLGIVSSSVLRKTSLV